MTWGKKEFLSFLYNFSTDLRWFFFPDVNESEEEAINYPIEDLLLPPDLDDADITQRPSPSRDFSVPMDCVGDLLMVWDFCTSFGRQLHLWRFSLEDFENAVCHKESNLVLIMEVHACLFRFLINERGENFKALQRRSRKSKVRSSSHGNHPWLTK